MYNRKIQLSHIIKDLEKSPEKKTTNFGDFTIIKIPTPADEKSDNKNKYYAIYTGGTRWWRPWKKKPGLVGEGGFGSVYLTFPIVISSELPEIVGFDFERNRPRIQSRTKTPEIDPKTKKPYSLYVTKVVDFRILNAQDNAKELLLKEVEIFGKYYRAEPYVIQVGKDAYTITEYLPGMRLTPEIIRKLNYSQRLAIIQEVLFNINLMHHETARTGTAFVHKDIKPDNIHVHLLYNDPENPRSGVKEVSAHLMDFGLVRIIDEDNPNRMFQNNRHWGTVGYIAPEVSWGPAGNARNGPLDIGLKSDIYSLTPVILMILGGSNPIAPHELLWNLRREQPTEPSVQHYENTKTQPDYDFSGIFEGYTLPDKDIQALVTQLLQRMQLNDYKKRPNSDELLKFFTILRLHDSLNVKEKEVTHEKSAYLAELILLVHGQWSQDYENHLSQDSKDMASKIIQQWKLKPEVQLNLADIFPAKESISLNKPQ